MTTIAQPSRASGGVRGVNARGFLAGGTATTALIAGAIVLFASLATYVAFNAVGGGGDDASSATVDGHSAGAPEAIAARAAAPGAVAAAPAAPRAVAPPPVAQRPGGAGTAVTGTPPSGPGVTDPTDPGLPAPPNGAPASHSGPLGGTVAGLEHTTGNLGLDVPLQDAADPLTGPLDDTVNNTLNNVGGLLDNPDLGDQVTSGVNGATNGLLGQGGLTDRLLNGGS